MMSVSHLLQTMFRVRDDLSTNKQHVSAETMFKVRDDLSTNKQHVSAEPEPETIVLFSIGALN